jgi:DNA-binding FadR family transcriptional regulator
VAKVAGQRPRLSDVLYTDLLREINSGRYSAGSRLPSETEFSTQFGVSRPTVREALGRLRKEGVIRSRKGSGSYVSASSQAGAPVMSGTNRTVSSIADVQRLYQYRISLEGEIACIAAQNRSDGDIDVLLAATEALARSVDENSDGTDEDIAFHRAIAIASGNSFFVEALDRIVADMQFIVRLARTLLMGRPVKNIETVQKEHKLVVEAIRNRDPEAARERMRFHIGTAQARLFFGETSEGSSLWLKRPPL